MAGENEKDRIPQDVSDIGSADQLLSYATSGQLEQLLRQRSDLSMSKIAEAAGLSHSSRRAAAASLSHALRDGPSAGQLQKLDRIISPLSPNLNGTGGLSSLALRLSEERRGAIKESLTAQVPPGWTGKILRDRPSSELEVLIQASALLSAFMSAEKLDADSKSAGDRSVAAIRDRYGQQMDLLVKRLVLISASPPTSRNYDAQILLGSLASYAFEPMRDQLESGVRYSPLAFRVWRAITKLVMLSGDGAHTGELRSFVRNLIRDSGDLREYSLYAGRSLDLELAITVPASWSPPGEDWVGEALQSRARDGDATIRERGTAVMGLWQRAFRSGEDLAKVADELRKLVAESMSPDSRPDAASGLEWIAATLEQAIEDQTPVCNTWPQMDQPWFHHVQKAADELGSYGIPAHLLAGTKSLFRHMILQNAGVYRRHALETIVTSGYNKPVAEALCFLLRNEKSEPWLRIRAEFALGFLQRSDPAVEAALTKACIDAYGNLQASSSSSGGPTRSHITEMHASLFAVGDCFGVEGLEERARGVRESLLPVLTGLAGLDDTQAYRLRRATRAAAYLLAVTAQPREAGQQDLSQTLLEQFSQHRDPVTSRLSKWALSFRFAGDGRVRPLLDGAELGKHDDIPYQDLRLS